MPQGLLKVATVLPHRETKLYSRPTIDTILRVRTGRGLVDFELDQKIAEYVQLCRRQEQTKVEQRRVAVRLRIVAAAELLWEGNDPAFTACLSTIQDLDEASSTSHLKSEDMFRAFRERFAPTQVLRSFLFPAHLLTFTPTSLSYFEHGVATVGTWLYDPTKELCTPKDFAQLSDVTIKFMALSMLHSLIGYHGTANHFTGSETTSFVKAANAYHTLRLKNELSSGSVMRMEFANILTPDIHLRGIRKLRLKLGLSAMSSSTQHLRYPHLTPYQQTPHGDSGFSNARAEELANKHFIRLATLACTRCPHSGYIFYPAGLDGLLRHVRRDHPTTFWTSTFHCLA